MFSTKAPVLVVMLDLLVEAHIARRLVMGIVTHITGTILVTNTATHTMGEVLDTVIMHGTGEVLDMDTVMHILVVFARQIATKGILAEILGETLGYQ